MVRKENAATSAVVEVHDRRVRWELRQHLVNAIRSYFMITNGEAELLFREKFEDMD